eukprot:bmy_07732T0
MQESRPKKVAPIQRRKKPASQKKRWFKTHSEHLAWVLKDYSDIAPGKINQIAYHLKYIRAFIKIHHSKKYPVDHSEIGYVCKGLGNHGVVHYSEAFDQLHFPLLTLKLERPDFWLYNPQITYQVILTFRFSVFYLSISGNTMKDEFKDDQLGTYGKRFARAIRYTYSKTEKVGSLNSAQVDKHRRCLNGILKVPVQGVTSTDRRKTQIIYPLDLKSNFPPPPDGAHTQRSVKTRSYVHPQAYRSQLVTYPTPLSDSTIPEDKVITVSSLANPTIPKTAELEPPKIQNRRGKGIGKDKTDPLKPHSLGEARVAGNSVLTSFFLWAQAEGTP